MRYAWLNGQGKCETSYTRRTYAYVISRIEIGMMPSHNSLWFKYMVKKSRTLIATSFLSAVQNRYNLFKWTLKSSAKKYNFRKDNE